MKKIGLFRKIKLYFQYRKILKSLKVNLSKDFNIRMDRVYRLYTVINVPAKNVEEPYNFRKSDIDNIAQSYIKEYTKELSNYLNESGLSELYEFYDIRKVDKFSYLVIFGFSLFDTKRMANIIYWRVTPVLVLTILSLVYYFLKS